MPILMGTLQFPSILYFRMATEILSVTSNQRHRFLRVLKGTLGLACVPKTMGLAASVLNIFNFKIIF